MSQADLIRAYAKEHFVDVARRGNQQTVTIVAGDVGKGLGLSNRMPNVCQALGGVKFFHMADVELLSREGPAQGASTRFNYAILPPAQAGATTPRRPETKPPAEMVTVARGHPASHERLTTGFASNKRGFDLAAIIAGGETDRVEFKGSLRTNLHTGKRDARMESAVLKTIAGFLNTHGGTLIIGMADDGSAVGIDSDGFANEDKMLLHLTNLVNDRIGPRAWTTMETTFPRLQLCSAASRAL